MGKENERKLRQKKDDQEQNETYDDYKVGICSQSSWISSILSPLLELKVEIKASEPTVLDNGIPILALFPKKIKVIQFHCPTPF